ncbi:hypothetical protein M3Y98_01119400 [Aphelenchoides besseyi]|nr:hypothetical protein M3Y98_01119400 [Aphelenchoides besseyi]
MVSSDEQWTEPEKINLSIEDYTAIYLDKPFIEQLKTFGLWNEARKLTAEFQRTTKETIEKKCSMDSVARRNQFEVAFAKFTQRQLSELYSVIDEHVPVGFPMPDGQKLSNLDKKCRRSVALMAKSLQPSNERLRYQ